MNCLGGVDTPDHRTGRRHKADAWRGCPEGLVEWAIRPAGEP